MSADPLDLVKAYTGTVVVDVARRLALLAIQTDPAATVAEHVLRVTEGARLLCGVGPPSYKYLHEDELIELYEMRSLYIVPEDTE